MLVPEKETKLLKLDGLDGAAEQFPKLAPVLGIIVMVLVVPIVRLAGELNVMLVSGVVGATVPLLTGSPSVPHLVLLYPAM